MKIVKQGKINHIVRMKKCKFCNTVFTYNEDDALVIYNAGKNKIRVGVVCPVCEEIIKISAFDKKAK